MVWAAGLPEAGVITSSFRRACAATGVLAAVPVPNGRGQAGRGPEGKSRACRSTGASAPSCPGYHICRIAGTRHRLARLGAAGVLAATGVAATVAVAGPVSATPSSAACTTVRVIAARASTEAPGDGVIGSLVTLIQNDVSASVSQEAVVYPARLTNYSSSVAQGESSVMP